MQVLSRRGCSPGGGLRAQERYRGERQTADRVSERDLRSFDTLLDAYPEKADELYRDPELITNGRFLRGHAELRAWLEDHPEAAEAIQDNPYKYLRRERQPQPQDFLRELFASS